MQNALVLGGKTGLLGQALTTALTDANWQVFSPSRSELDIFDRVAVEREITERQITTVFNTVAYTAVDQAEDEPGDADRVNRFLPRLLGQVVKETGTGLVHYSTDFVFSGKKNTPYTPEDSPDPESVYGKTKYAGEQELLSLNLEKMLIIRTSWLFGPGKTNFVTRILELAKARAELGIVHDQVGSPSCTTDLAKNSVLLVDTGVQGLFHLANSGQASWCELATEAVRCAGLQCRVRSITSAEYPQKARRPAYSVLDLEKFIQTTGCTPRPWVQALREFLFSAELIDS